MAESKSPPAHRPTHAANRRRGLFLIVGAVAGAVVVLAVLFWVPFPTQVTYRAQFHSTAASPPECVQTTAGLEVSSGREIHLAWYTTPTVVISLAVGPWAGGLAIYNGTGTSGSTTFSSTGGAYLLVASNCAGQETTVVVSAYCDTQAPIL